MIQKVHVQILDNTVHDTIFTDKEFQQPATNKLLADELKQELHSSYPSMVSVEYIDLFMLEDNEYFNDITELLRQGAIHAPLILINGILKIHGGIPPKIIKKEVEKLLFSGPVH
jgi:disulfide oxidoreductase YuzD